MKKILISALFVLGLSGYAVMARQSQGVAVPVPDVAVTNTPRSAPRRSATLPPTLAVTPTNPKGQYTDGTYTGSAADAYYGIVQVKAIIQNGKIADVQFLQYPNDRPESQRINSYATQYLTQEAIAAQNAQVDTVSGASETSAAFRESLQSALSQAQA